MRFGYDMQYLTKAFLVKVSRQSKSWEITISPFLVHCIALVGILVIKRLYTCSICISREIGPIAETVTLVRQCLRYDRE